MIINIQKLISAYYTENLDPFLDEQKVAFGTSGHRGSSLSKNFNEPHILSVVEAICLYRKQNDINGPLFLGIDTHALSEPARITAIEVLAGNNVNVMLSENDEYVPTPAISLAILNYNRGRKSGFADGIVITPSHNPPAQGGIKYNSIQGGPAELSATKWIETKANEILQNGLSNVKRFSFEKALKASTTHKHNFLQEYVTDLASVIDMKVIQASKVHIGADPMGGAGVHYWKAIAERYGLNLTVVNETVDPTFRFMNVDWDGQIRMDPSSIHAMKHLIEQKEHFDITVACDTDHDRHGIVTKKEGLLPSNHYLSAAIYYLFQNRPLWSKYKAIGKTIVTSKMIDRIALKLEKNIYETPVGFKWFVDGLFDESLGFGGEESAGATFSRLDGTAWTTDKDGIAMALLAAEITAKMGRDPGEIYQQLTQECGNPFYERVEAAADLRQRKCLKTISPKQITNTQLAGEKIEAILTQARGNEASIDGVMVETQNGWFAARPSGTEDIYKIYGESFINQEHLKTILAEAQGIVDKALAQ